MHRDSSAELTSKYGFSVVAPISVTSPSSTACSTESCWPLLKRWISSMNRIVRWPLPPRRSRARAITARTSSTRADTADSSSNAAPVLSATIRAIVVFPVPGGPKRIIEGGRSCSIARRSAEPGAEDVLLADELVERGRPQAYRERGVLGLALLRGFGEEVAHARSMLGVSMPARGRGLLARPILPGERRPTTSGTSNTDGAARAPEDARTSGCTATSFSSR